jgi:hypothetical protein
MQGDNKEGIAGTANMSVVATKTILPDNAGQKMYVR